MILGDVMMTHMGTVGPLTWSSKGHVSEVLQIRDYFAEIHSLLFTVHLLLPHWEKKLWAMPLVDSALSLSIPSLQIPNRKTTSPFSHLD